MRPLAALLAFLCLSLFAETGEAPSTQHNGGTNDANSAGTPPSLCSAFGYLFGSNAPATLEEAKQKMLQDWEVVETTIPFSEAIDDSSLENPRHFVGIGRPKQGNKSRLGADLQGRFFLGVNLKCNREKKTLEPKKVEFISWNFSTKRFDFGLIEGIDSGAAVTARVVPREQCIGCHKTGGPIFRDDPWTNSISRREVSLAMTKTLVGINPAYGPDPDAFYGRKRFADILGLDLHKADSGGFDGSTRLGASILRAQALPQTLKDTKLRETMVLGRLKLDLYDNFQWSGPMRFDPVFLAKRREAVDAYAKATKAMPWAPDAPELRENTLPISEDLSEVLPGTADTFSLDEEKVVASVLAYNEKRKTLKRDPLDPKSPRNFNERISEEHLEKTFSFTANQETGPQPAAAPDPYLPDPTPEAMQKAVERYLAKEKQEGNGENYFKALDKLTDEVLGGPPFAAFRERGTFPEYHEYIPLFFDSLNQVMAKHGLPADFKHGMEVDPRLSHCGVPVTAAAPVANTAPKNKCSACHEGPELKERMKLPFPPYDRLQRENWVLENDPATVRRELSRIKEWVFDTAQMPPDYSAEFKEGFDRDSAENRSLKKFLETELQRVAPRP